MWRPATLGLVLLAASPAQALRLRAAHVRAGSTALESLEVDFDGATLDVAAASATARALGPPALRALEWRCTAVVAAQASSCRGPASLERGGRRHRGTLSMSRDPAQASAALASGKARVALTVPRDAPATLALEALPLAWITRLAPMPARLVPGGGTLGGALMIAAFDPPAATGELRFDGVGFDSTDGELAASGLAGRARIDFAGAAPNRTLSLDASFASGEWLVAPVYVEIAGRPIDVSLTISQRVDGYDVGAWRWHDRGAVVAAGTASLGRDFAPQRIDASRLDVELATAYPRYARSALAGSTLGTVEAAGRVSGTVAWRPDAPLAGRLELGAVSLRDASGRFAIEQLAGVLPLSPADPTQGTLRWQHAAIFGIGVGAGAAELRADRAGHSLAQPLVLDVLDGKVRIPRFELAESGARTRVVASAKIDDLSVAALTRALGWPVFDGRLSGRIPAVRSEAGTIAFDGGLTFDVFGGRVEVASLVLERGFGVAPSLAADVVIEDLDLVPLTSAFSFGTIEGRLDGRIDDLRLLDGSPVAFDLALRTDPSHEGRRRISQRAVNSLSTVGGAGPAAGIQRGVLRVFDSFPYAEIGLSCRLANHVCEMGGLDERDGGYTIVRGAGLPRLTVVGHQRRVDWPVLVARLEAATKGARPVIE